MQSRRAFVRNSAGTIVLPQVRPSQGANDRIGVGVIGCGSMGRVNLSDFQQAGADIVAVCDVYRTNLDRAHELTGRKARLYTDYRKLLEDPAVQAVVIATPEHWHALMCVDACAAGKDVYVEKPVSHCIREGRLMVEAARRHNRVVQVGLQQRSGTHFQRAVRVVQEGHIGKVHYVQTWYHSHTGPEGFGNPPDTPPPAGLDWDSWLGPAPVRTFNPNRFIGRWRYFWDYGGGELVDWGVHLVDIVHWAMQASAPHSATASGGRYHITDNTDTPDTLTAEYEYPGFVLSWSALFHNSYGRNGDPGWRPYGSYGIQFHGTQGTLFVDRAGYEIVPQCRTETEARRESYRETHDDATGLGMYFTGVAAPERGTTSRQHLPHVRNFLECVKSRQRPIADIEAGHLATAACHLGNIAFRVGAKLSYDAAAEQVTNHPEANGMVTREYRRPWQLKGL